MEQEPIKPVTNRNPDGTFGAGNNANPYGRPKGKTLKEWLKDRLQEMDDKQRRKFLKDIPKEMQWRMAEGNPQSDVTSGGEKINPIPIYGGLSSKGHDSSEKVVQSDKENTGC